MTLTPWPRGLLTALVTPLRDDQLDVTALRRVIEDQLDAGISGFVVGGGTGEYGALDAEERTRLTEEALATVHGRVPVVIQTGALTTRGAIALTRHAQDHGATGVLVASPYGEPINWRERFTFYEQLTAVTSIPMMIYNTPPSGLMTLDQIQQLAQLPHISAVKDSSGSAEMMGDLVEWAADSGFGVYVGLDSLLFDALSGGARGAVFGASNVIPRPLMTVVGSLIADGPTPPARALWAHVRRFLRYFEQTPNYMASCKAGLNVRGFEVGEVRAPYLMPGEVEVRELAGQIQSLDRAMADSGLAPA